MRINKPTWKWLTPLFAVLAFVGAGVHFSSSNDVRDFDHVNTQDSRTTEILEATIARINKESAETAIARAYTPTGITHRVERQDSVPVSRQVTPPTGYSFVEHNGRMINVPLETSVTLTTERDVRELTWLDPSTSIEMLVAHAERTGRDWSFGWILKSDKTSASELEFALQGTAARIIGGAGRLVRAKLPADRAELHTIRDLSAIDGFGAVPPSLKMQLVTQYGSANELIPVFVTLMTDDPEGLWRRALESYGAVVGQFDPAIRVYAAHATKDVLEAIASSDFVVSIESVGVTKAVHDTAVPAMGADALRMYQESQRLFSGVGGASVPIAVMDSGLNVNHLDISSNRTSICGANFVYYEPVIDDEDLWVDAGLHGTHVTGTIVGNGAVQRRYSGMAPSVEHIRFAKVLNHWGFGSDIFILRGMDYLARSTACPESGWSVARIRPLIVNMSLSRSARVWEGRTVAERKLDSVVWNQRQLYVVAQSNEDIHGLSNYASAKNSLAVGAVIDSGELATFSSHGPTADGRLAPQVVGTGGEHHFDCG